MRAASQGREVSRTVLIIDDSRDDREYYARLLAHSQRVSYGITEAEDGEKGLAILADGTFDCILLDYSLPGTSGLEVLGAIRAGDPHIPVIMLTGQGDIGIAVNALKEGANDYLVKSADLSARLDHAIGSAVEAAANARRAERSQRYLRQMLDHIPDPIFMKDREHRWVDGNSAFWTLMRGGRDQFIGSCALDIFPAETAALMNVSEAVIFETGDVAVEEEHITDLAGEAHVLLTRKGVFRDLDDRELLVGVSHDITAMKAQQLALETSERTFRKAIENAVNGMALVSPDGHWLKVNRALCRLLGYDEEELLARDIATLTHADDRADDAAQLIAIWSEEEGVREYEKRFVHANGQIITVLQSVSLVRHGDGRPNYLVVQMADLTEARKMDRMKSEFISTVSHELRTPLTSIRGSLGLLTQPFAAALSETGRDLVQIAADNCERLIGLINDILDIDKIATGEMHLEMMPFDVIDLVAHAVRVNAAYAEKYRVALKLGKLPAGRAISVDEARFAQVMANLISNAVKFSGDADHVDLFAREEEGRIRICVSDHGGGVDEAFRDRIFGRFAQADSSVSRAKNGSGLGLHISRQLVEAMGGAIGFDSTPGEGATFWIEFPAAAPLLVARDGRSKARA